MTASTIRCPDLCLRCEVAVLRARVAELEHKVGRYGLAYHNARRGRANARELVRVMTAAYEDERREANEFARAHGHLYRRASERALIYYPDQVHGSVERKLIDPNEVHDGHYPDDYSEEGA